jgi:hypothetical protein
MDDTVDRILFFASEVFRPRNMLAETVFVFLVRFGWILYMMCSKLKGRIISSCKCLFDLLQYLEIDMAGDSVR